MFNSYVADIREFPDSTQLNTGGLADGAEGWRRAEGERLVIVFLKGYK